ncbi:acyl-CoA dehydrogenase family protein [Streptomyces sp. P1-3]|uniref:acyl-CoA dehydrogenase family protein n=1 Tax=Streptomyces sp. P1-3 TaxID=3421658 RepID=UPI003D361244
MDLALSEEQTAVRELAREFVAREVAPHAARWDRAESVDRRIVGKLGALGFLGLTIPEEYGASAGDHLAYVLVTEELGRGDSSVRGIVSVSLGLVAKAIVAWGSEEQKREWLPRLCSGEAVGCFGLTEPGTGSGAANLTTRAVRGGDDYVITGSKMFITNGTWADVVLLFARTGAEPGRRGVSAFLVPADAPGLTRRTVRGKLGLRGQATAELVLDGVRVPAAARVADESSVAKLYASEAAVRCANNALQVFGGYGYIDECPVGKLLRDARVMTLYEGTSQIHKLLIGRALTGVSTF